MGILSKRCSIDCLCKMSSDDCFVQDLMFPLAASCVHKSSDVHLCQALLGGSHHEFSLACCPVPSGHGLKTYGQLYAAMCQQGQIPIALFRTSAEDRQEYIFTNPAKCTTFQEGDLVYCTQSHSAGVPKLTKPRRSDKPHHSPRHSPHPVDKLQMDVPTI